MIYPSAQRDGARAKRAYTVHIGQRSEEWPAAIPETFPTRSEAVKAARGLLMLPVSTSMGLTKAEVRLDWRLMDCLSRRPNSTELVYSATQRERSVTE